MSCDLDHAQPKTNMVVTKNCATLLRFPNRRLDFLPIYLLKYFNVMPGDNWSIFGSGSWRKTAGIGIWTKHKLHAETNDLVRSTRVLRNSDFRNQIKNDRVCTSKKHFASEQIGICSDNSYFIFLPEVIGMICCHTFHNLFLTLFCCNSRVSLIFTIAFNFEVHWLS